MTTEIPLANAPAVGHSDTQHEQRTVRPQVLGAARLTERSDARIMDTIAALSRFRSGSKNARMAEMLLAGGEFERAELADAAGAAVNAVNFVVKQLRLAGVDVQRRVSQTTGRATLWVPIEGDVIREAEVEQHESEATGPHQIKMVDGAMWVCITIPGMGHWWGRATADGLVDLQQEEPGA